MAFLSSYRLDSTRSRPSQAPLALATWLLFAAIFAAVYVGSLFSPPLLDDVDAAHAQAAQHIADSGNWITCQINGIRYIEKPPLPYWLVAVSYKRLRREHLCHPPAQCAGHAGPAPGSPGSGRAAPGARAPASMPAWACSLPSGRFSLPASSFPRRYLSLFLLIALYGLITGFEFGQPSRFYWIVGRRGPGPADQGADRARLLCGRGRSLPAADRPVAPLARAQACHRDAALSGHRRALAHPLRAGQSRPGPPRRQPPHPRQRARLLVLLLRQRALPALLRRCAIRTTTTSCPLPPTGCCTWSGSFPGACFCPRWWPWPGRPATTGSSTCATTPARRWISTWTTPTARTWPATSSGLKFRVRTIWLLSLFSAWTLFFFSLSTNQEYYTFPVWPPLFILIAGVLAGIEEKRGLDGGADGGPGSRNPLLSTAWLTGAQAVFAVVGVLAAAGPRLGSVGLAQPALCGRHRHPAGAPRRGRLHALHVPLLRPHRPILCRAAPARRAGRRRPAHRPGCWAGCCGSRANIWPPPSASPSPRPSS